MPSRADLSPLRRARQISERLLRALLILALIFAIRHALFAMDERPASSVSGGEHSLREKLAEWSTASSPRSVHLKIDSTPAGTTLDWAAALRGADTRVSWGSSIPALGIAVDPIVDPKATSRVLLASPSAAKVALSDSLGSLDSISVRKTGASAGPFILHGALHAALDGAGAVSAQADSLIVRPVLVLGRAGWEGKFIAASLEEYGWKVSARLNVSPGNDVAQGTASTSIDTSLYSAVIVLDSSAGRYAAAVERFVRSGGGLVAIGEGASLRSLQGILPGVASETLPGGEVNAGNPRNGFALRPLFALKPDAIPLEKRGARVAIAARRVQKGRVVQIGYEDTWRWRMAGSGDAIEDYRNWISSVVSSAAYAPVVSKSARASESSAPLARIYSSLGPPSSSAEKNSAGSEAFMLVMFILAIAALVLETASRRFDGRP